MNTQKSILHSQLAQQGWYPNEPSQLTRFLNQKLETDSKDATTKTKAIICPHAGYTYCGNVFAKGIQTIQHNTYTKAIIIGPSHYIAIKDQAVLTTYTGIQTPLGNQPIDQDTITRLQDQPHFQINDQVHDPEHSIQMHVPFLQAIFPRLPIVPIVIGNLDPDVSHSIAQSLKSIIDNQTLVMISSDFTHYGDRFGYLPFTDQDPNTTREKIKAIDMGAIDPIVENNLATYSDYIQTTENTICGRFAIQILLELCKDTQSECRLCEYQTSGDVTGDYSNSVSYASLSIQGAWQ